MASVPPEIVRRRCEADVQRAELGIEQAPIERISNAFERLADDYEPAVLAEACRGWLRVGERFRRHGGETVPVAPEAAARGRAFEAFVRGVLAAVEQLEDTGRSS